MDKRSLLVKLVLTEGNYVRVGFCRGTAKRLKLGKSSQRVSNPFMCKKRLPWDNTFKKIAQVCEPQPRLSCCFYLCPSSSPYHLSKNRKKYIGLWCRPID